MKSESVVELTFYRDNTVVEMESGDRLVFGTCFADNKKMTLDEFRDIYFNLSLGKIVIGKYRDE